MKTIKEIRRENLISIIDDIAGGNQAKLSRMLELNPTIINNIINQKLTNRNMGDDLARKIEDKIGKPEGWMDQVHISAKLEGKSTLTGKATVITPDSELVVGDIDQDIVDAVSMLMGGSVSPNTRNTLTNIAQKAKDGKLTEEDVLLLGQIADKIEKK